jgi:CRP/FNR family transcriptional regulator, cyclic AMP receptor protein
VTNDQIRSFLRASPLLRPLDEASIGKLATQVRIGRWARNQTVLRKGDPGNAMMIVASGRVKIVSIAENGRERILNIIEPGESFGEMALLDGEPRCADSVAIEPTVALIVGRKQLDGLLQDNLAFVQRVIADLCQRLRKTTSLVEDSLFLDPATRLARRLRALAQDIGTTSEGETDVVLEGLTQKDLADAVGLTRESVNKVLRAWQAEGLVSLERRTVILKNPAALSRIARDFEAEVPL